MPSDQPLLFATHNQHKADEIRILLQNRFRMLTLQEAGIHEDIPETGHTLLENAVLKARYAYSKTSLDCFSDDTGLEVLALNGEPGVYSARYAGVHGDSTANVEKLLKRLEGVTSRRARFRTVIALFWKDTLYTFEGICQGQIALSPKGNGGFGYDPVFIPENNNRSFAEMTLEEKNSLSHRAEAVRQLVHFLLSQSNENKSGALQM